MFHTSKDLFFDCKGTNIILYKHYIYWLIIYQFRRMYINEVRRHTIIIMIMPSLNEQSGNLFPCLLLHSFKELLLQL